jgi:hypothetical protein
MLNYWKRNANSTVYLGFCGTDISKNSRVARMREGRGCTGFWWENLREGDHWGDPDVGGRIIFLFSFSLSLSQKKREVLLNTFETNILRRIFGTARQNGMWIIKI